MSLTLHSSMLGELSMLHPKNMFPNFRTFNFLLSEYPHSFSMFEFTYIFQFLYFCILCIFSIFCIFIYYFSFSPLGRSWGFLGAPACASSGALLSSSLQSKLRSKCALRNGVHCLEQDVMTDIYTYIYVYI